jgi:hypothetical protein
LAKKEKFERYTEEDYVKDVFEKGYADVAIFNPQILGDFYHKGFSNFERNDALRSNIRTASSLTAPGIRAMGKMGWLNSKRTPKPIIGKA